jgi:hypothetical protein
MIGLDDQRGGRNQGSLKLRTSREVRVRALDGHESTTRASSGRGDHYWGNHLVAIWSTRLVSANKFSVGGIAAAARLP